MNNLKYLYLKGIHSPYQINNYSIILIISIGMKLIIIRKLISNNYKRFNNSANYLMS